jgi:NADH:ubiquinone oxidoreductase subunit K
MLLIINFSFIFSFLILFFIISLFFLLLSLNHFIIVLIFLDLLLLVNILLLIIYTQITTEVIGYNYALLLLGVAASDTAVGLGLFILYYKTQGVVSIN